MNTFFYQNSMLTSAFEVINKISSLEYDAFLVGGCVRDIMMGVTPKDVDIATNCPIDVLEENFNVAADIGKNRDFGIILIEYNGFTYEVAQFRSESDYENGRHPSTVNICESFESDSTRRDFTFNAMGYDSEHNVIDYHNGLEDLNSKIVRTVGDPNDRFSEDFLRMLRCVRFASRLNFSIESNTFNAILSNCNKIVEISPERIKDELFKMASFSGDSFANAIVYLENSGLLKYVLPEVSNLKNFKHGQLHHPEGLNVFEHVIASLRVNTEINNPLLNISILLHDIGKALTYVYKGEDKHSYYGHDRVGSEMVDDVADRLKFSNYEREAIKFVISNHMKFHNIHEMKPFKILKIYDSPYYDLLMKTSYCDDSCRLHAFNENIWNLNVNRIAEVVSNRENNSIVNNINGSFLLDVTNIVPGPTFGRVLTTLKEWVVNENIQECDMIVERLVELEKLG